MKTVVKVCHGAAAEYVEWRDSLGELARLIERELHDELIRTEGHPGGALRASNRLTGTYHWRFSGNATYVPKQPTASGSVFGRAWRWVNWRIRRERVRAVTIMAIGHDLSPASPPTLRG